MMSIFKSTSRINHFSTKFSAIIISVLFFFASEVHSENTQNNLTLENKSFKGSVKAKGIAGLFSVNGHLSFEKGLLIWSTDDSTDIGKFEIHEHQDGIQFKATITTVNNEKVEWSGIYDGDSLYGVEALWTRNKGDFFHDLLLPDVVTLVFTTHKK